MRLQCELCVRQSGSKCPRGEHLGVKCDPKIVDNSEYGTLILGVVAVGSLWFGRKYAGEEEAKVCCKSILGGRCKQQYSLRLVGLVARSHGRILVGPVVLPQAHGDGGDGETTLERVTHMHRLQPVQG